MTENRPIRTFWWSCDKIEKKGFENFGDILTAYLIEKLSGSPCRWVDIRKRGMFSFLNNSQIQIVTGSILGLVDDRCVVWGAGVIRKKEQIKRADFRAVRGYRSLDRLQALGFTAPVAIGDPALLLPKIYDPQVKQAYPLGIIPHYVDHDQIEKRYGKYKQVKIIDVKTPVEDFIRDVKSCAQVISSSLHGIICCHAYGIPCLWYRFSHLLSGDDIKFEDYFSSVHISPYHGLTLQDKQPDDISASIASHASIALPRIELHSLQNNLIRSCPFISEPWLFLSQTHE